RRAHGGAHRPLRRLRHRQGLHRERPLEGHPRDVGPVPAHRAGDRGQGGRRREGGQPPRRADPVEPQRRRGGQAEGGLRQRTVPRLRQSAPLQRILPFQRFRASAGPCSQGRTGEEQQRRITAMASGFPFFLSPDPQEIDSLRGKAIWAIVLGVALAVVGVVAIGHPVVTSEVTMVFFGVLLLIGSGVQLASAVWARGWGGFFLQVLVGLLYFFVGVV